MKVRNGHPKGSLGAVLIMFCRVILKWGRQYCWVTQEHQRKLLFDYNKFTLARSTLNLWLNWLEDERWIIRYSGYLENKCGKGVNRASSFYLTRKAIRWLISQGIKGAERLFSPGVRFSGHHKVNPNKILGFVGGLFGFNKHSLALKGKPLPVTGDG